MSQKQPILSKILHDAASDAKGSALGLGVKDFGILAEDMS
jgi:hypothetical protein